MYSFQPVAILHSCFKEKFAIPRQPALAPAAKGQIELLAPFDDPHALQGLEGISHLWITFVFHQAIQAPDEVRLRVRPPRLGGNQKVGVFSTRSTHRPNPIGLSVVKLEKIEGTKLYVSGIDLLDQTPILDIKPYVPYADIVTSAENKIAEQAPELITVQWQEEAKLSAEKESKRLNQDVIALIEQCLAQDPKPAYQTPDSERQYGVQFWDLNIRWHYPEPDCIRVLSVTPVNSEASE